MVDLGATVKVLADSLFCIEKTCILIDCSMGFSKVTLKDTDPLRKRAMGDMTVMPTSVMSKDAARMRAVKVRARFEKLRMRARLNPY